MEPGHLPCPCGLVHPVPTVETLHAFKASQKRVDWGRDGNGDPVYTNGIMEDALGLTPFINGWGGDGGYYVTPGIHAQAAAAIVAAIDWDRIDEVKTRFDIPFNWNDKPGMFFDGRLLVDDETHTKLLRLCYRSVPDSEFRSSIEALLPGRCSTPYCYTKVAVNTECQRCYDAEITREKDEERAR